ncbi:hypothetical protein BGX34_007467 [Mortierella sp. NVP85]|nr:hypothetical protein BGX34_007467 [Mortierella sp. NVP85]
MSSTSIFSSPRGLLSPQKVLELANVYLENAFSATDPDITLVLCHDTQVSLSQAKESVKDDKNQTVTEGIAIAYIGLESYRPGAIKETLQSAGGSQGTGPSRSSALDQRQRKKLSMVTATVPDRIFPRNNRSTIKMTMPESGERFKDTAQLVCCLSLLKAVRFPDTELEPTDAKWIQTIEKNTKEQERLNGLSTDVIRAFTSEDIGDAKVVAEVVCLVPILDKDLFRELLEEFYSGIDASPSLTFQQLEGIARLIQGAGPGYLSSDDLVKILKLLSTRMMNTHQQSPEDMYQLTLAVSHILDAMADTQVTDLDREKLHEPLSSYLSVLRKNSDPFLVYQAAYAYQALLCVPDDETTWQSVMRRTGRVVQGVPGLVSEVKGFDLNRFIEGLENIHEGISGESRAFGTVISTYDKVSSLVTGGQGLMDSLKEGSSFERKRDWYSALRAADILIQNGEVTTFKRLVCEAPCRYDPAFQWGVCQRLGEMAGNPKWDKMDCRDAVEFLGEIYMNDEAWGQHISVKQWILNILMQLSSLARGPLLCKWGDQPAEMS